MATASGRTWRQMAIAAIVVLAISAITFVGGAAFFFYRHIRSEVVPAGTADARIAAARARFGGQPALLRIDADGDAALAGRQTTGNSPAPVAALRALAYEPGRERLVDVTVPFWLLRLAPNGRISFGPNSGINFDAERLNINLAALEELGPGLVLDQSEPSGARLLIWTE